MTDVQALRDAQVRDIGPLASIWYDGWQDAHARILPIELALLRTRESFEERLREALGSVRVAEAADAPVGFCMLRGDELYQLYVSSQARGCGVAAALMADAEARLRQRGVQTAWLACAIGNERAARFYEKCGWRQTGITTEQLQVPNGTFALEVWRYVKSLK
jgi:ribosomal protein S18 acetylase RimI-like enzyme